MLWKCGCQPRLFLPVSAFCQAPLPEGVYRVGKSVTSPSVIGKTDPQYSEEARIAKLSGAVQISAVVGVDGKVRDVRVTKSVGLGLDKKAVEAVGTWQFKPGIKDGTPVPVMIDVEVNFRLPVSDWALDFATSRSSYRTPLKFFLRLQLAPQ